MNFEQELSLHLRAGYPIVFVVSAEEKRASSLVMSVCEQEGLRLCVPRIPGKTSSLESQLAAVSEDADVVLIDDAHRRLEDPNTLRLLADSDKTLWKNRNGQGTLVIVTPWTVIPPELERICAVLDVPLPTVDQLRHLLIRICEGEGVLLIEEDIRRMVRIAMGLTDGEAGRAFTRAMLAFPEDARKAQESIEQDKLRALHRSRVLEYVDVDTTLEHVGGMDQLKRWLLLRKDAFGPEARQFGLPAPKGLLLMGVQGCGKSLAAKAVGGFWQLPVVRLDVGAVFGMASAEYALANALRTAEAMAPLILWIDEIEKGFDIDAKGRSARLLGILITWLQEKRTEVFVVATANRVENLPPELPRKGRFDDVFFVDLPDDQERRDILEMHMKKRGLNVASYDMDVLIRKTEKMTGSELEQLVVSALYFAFERKAPPEDNDFSRALIGNVSLYDTYESEIKKLREWARTRARSASMDRTKLNFFRSEH